MIRDVSLDICEEVYGIGDIISMIRDVSLAICGEVYGIGDIIYSVRRYSGLMTL